MPTETVSTETVSQEQARTTVSQAPANATTTSPAQANATTTSRGPANAATTVGPAQAAPDERPASQPGSLERGIDLLLALSAASRPVTLSQLCRSTGLPKSTAHRILGVLCSRELARRVGNAYLPGELLESMAGITRARVPGTRRVVLPYLLYLFETTRQTVNLAVPSGLEIRYVERLYGHNRVGSRSDGLDRAPLHCTATGKALLAFDPKLRQELLARGTFERLTRRTITSLAGLERELAQVRRHGIAYSQEEFTEGVACVAAPVFGPGGRICMAVGVAAPAHLAPLAKLGISVRGAAQAISAALLGA
ncbi:helix-turn-helix domain-containing protein [Nonomuraea sp. FMUSA5-5]|uniref:Helix-turn-helix domain-containing protein n=1 Tax=Nonomuraea composti TaxID=2720023 RepID=A0ABX1AR82_9ACTN|nr:IclR family transcriptional regulator [Nonomuraea sp. FMUSA5-5]NJP88165.1 helix-turn-helix domain-containing protein [Nonomuraea sp. FMUSA5-5]